MDIQFWSSWKRSGLRYIDLRIINLETVGEASVPDEITQGVRVDEKSRGLKAEIGSVKR